MKILCALPLGVLAVALMLAGCGSESSGNQESSGTSRIQLESPAVRADGVISPHVSCGLGTIWLPLKWSSPPSGTKELILYFGRFKKETVDGAQGVRVSFAAMITGISPELHGMAANTFPSGAGPQYFVSH